MYLLIDGLRLQTGSRQQYAAELLAALRDARPDWRLEVSARADLPAIDPDTVAGLPIRVFHPPLPVTPDNRAVLDRYYAGWLDAHGSDWTLHTDLFEPEGLVPIYRARRVRAAAVVHDLNLPTSLAEYEECATRFRSLAGMDLLLASTPALADEAVRLIGPNAPPVVTAGGRSDTRSGTVRTGSRRPSGSRRRWSNPHACPPRLDGLGWRGLLRPRHRRRGSPITRRRWPPSSPSGSTWNGCPTPPDLPRNLPTVECRSSRRIGSRPGTPPGRLHPHAAQAFSPLSRRVLELAVGVVVHSHGAWQQVRRAADAHVTVVPLIAAGQPVGERAAERLRLPADRFLVCTLGIVGPPKRVAVLVRAVAALPADVRRRSTILLAGPCEPEYRRQIESLAEELGLRDQVTFLGRVPLDDFPAYAVAADVCVQLRYPSNWETSESLIRALAAGAACVTSDTGSMLELPNAVALKVRSPVRDVTDLTAALTRLTGDPTLRDRLGENARQYVAKTHAPEVVAAGYAATIGQTLSVLAARDAVWSDDTLNALADLPGDIPPGLIEVWAELRTRSARREAETHLELPVVQDLEPLKRRAS